jgi:hypothetical protein
MGQVSSGQRIPVHREIGRHALELHRAALLPGARPQIDDSVGPGDHVRIVLDDDDRGAGVDQPVVHEAGLRQQARVARHAGLRDVHGRDEVADGALAVVQDLDEGGGASGREDGEDIGGHRTVYAWWCIYTLANVVPHPRRAWTNGPPPGDEPRSPRRSMPRERFSSILARISAA